MDNPVLMTPKDIHNFGIEIVFNDLQKDGYKIISVNDELGMNPQIIATKDNQTAFIAVRTDCYPNKGILENSTHFQMIEHAAKNNAIPYFASVGIANSDGKNDEEMSIPVKGAGFYVSYEGIMIITTSDKVRII